MKTSISFWGIFISLFLISCNQKEVSTAYTIEGTTADSTLNGKMLYLEDLDKNQKFDSTVVTNNRFVFEGNIDSTRYVQIDNREEYVNLILEPGNIKVDLEKHTATGTPLNKEFELYRLESDSLHNIARELYEDLEKEKDLEKRALLRKDLYQKWHKDYMDFVSRFFIKNKDNELATIILRDIAMESTAEEFTSLAAKGGAIVHKRESTSSLLKLKQAALETGENKMFVDITGEDIKGEKVALSKYVGKGKYILVDFWASWCGPCRMEIPHMKTLHKQYKNKNLEIVSIAVWDKVEDTKKAIKEDKTSWIQILNAGEQASDKYGVLGIPCFILIDPSGKIIGRDLRGDFLDQKLADVLTPKK